MKTYLAPVRRSEGAPAEARDYASNHLVLLTCTDLRELSGMIDGSGRVGGDTTIQGSIWRLCIFRTLYDEPQSLGICPAEAEGSHGSLSRRLLIVVGPIQWDEGFMFLLCHSWTDLSVCSITPQLLSHNFLDINYTWKISKWRIKQCKYTF